MTVSITREIGIDMGHRVTNHGSKCRSVHGHRYKIIAKVSGDLATSGEEEGMVLDFGFLKESMMELIDRDFDHSMTIWQDDELLMSTLSPGTSLDETDIQLGYKHLMSDSGSLNITTEVPTAENLAKLWFNILCDDVAKRTENRAELLSVTVWETPNCEATYTKP